MHCQNCNQELADSDTLCPRCGTPRVVQPTTAPAPATSSNGKIQIRWGWILLLMIPVTILAYALEALIINATGTQGGVLQVISNLVIFFIGAIGVFGFPAGVVLLILGYTNKSKSRRNI